MRKALMLVAVLAPWALSSCGKSDGLPALSCAPAASWSTVDDYSPSESAANGGVAITATARRHVFVIGSASDSGGNNHWIVRSSSNRGSTWSTVDDYQLEAGQSTYPSGISADFDGAVYAVGNPYASDGSHWTVRKSTDSGASWTTVDDVPGAQATAALYRPSAGLHVFGQLQSGSIPWASRKSANGGASWADADSFGLSGNGAMPIAASVDLSGNLYAVGFALDSGASTHWITRKSADGGASWSTVDDYQLSAGSPSTAISVAIDSLGVVYVAGNGSDASSQQHWVVRRSADGGATWSTVRQARQNGTTAGATAVGFGHLGEVYVAGAAGDGSGNGHWLVEVSPDGGATWATSDAFEYSGAAGTELSSQALGFAFAPSGDLYVTGQAVLNAAGNPARWITRRLACL